MACTTSLQALNLIRVKQPASHSWTATPPFYTICSASPLPGSKCWHSGVKQEGLPRRQKLVKHNEVIIIILKGTGLLLQQHRCFIRRWGIVYCSAAGLAAAVTASCHTKHPHTGCGGWEQQMLTLIKQPLWWSYCVTPVADYSGMIKSQLLMFSFSRDTFCSLFNLLMMFVFKQLTVDGKKRGK